MNEILSKELHEKNLELPPRVVSTYLTRPYSTAVERVASRSARIPFTVPVPTRRWRAVIRNINYRTNQTYPGQVHLTTVTVGRILPFNSEPPKESIVTAPEMKPHPIMLASSVDVPNIGVGWASDWQHCTLRPEQSYMMTYGYETSGIDVQLNIGGGWRTIGHPANASELEDSTAELTNRQPFDVRIEYEIDHDVPRDLIIGDSIATGSHSTFPVAEAPLALANRGAARATRLSAFGGAGFVEWISDVGSCPKTLRWRDITNYGRAERAFIALGNNDISIGADYADLVDRLNRLVQLVKQRVSTDITVCTVTPRTAWLDTEKEHVREQFNDYIRSRPEAVTSVAETAHAVEDESGHSPKSQWVTRDGVHFTTLGAKALARAIREAE